MHPSIPQVFEQPRPDSILSSPDPPAGDAPSPALSYDNISVDEVSRQGRAISPNRDPSGPSPRIVEPISPKSTYNYHPNWNFADGNVIIVVEGTYFKVHRSFLERGSEGFPEILKNMPTVSIEVIFPSGLVKAELEALLNFYYNGVHTNSRPLTLAQWIHLLSISETFAITRIREQAIYELTTNHTMEPVQKIALADKFGIDGWKTLSYEELVQRELKIQDDEAEILGTKTTARINRVREMLVEELAKEFKKQIQEAEGHMCGEVPEYYPSFYFSDWPTLNPYEPLPDSQKHGLRFLPARVSQLVYEEFSEGDERKKVEEERNQRISEERAKQKEEYEKSAMKEEEERDMMNKALSAREEMRLASGGVSWRGWEETQ